MVESIAGRFYSVSDRFDGTLNPCGDVRRPERLARGTVPPTAQPGRIAEAGGASWTLAAAIGLTAAAYALPALYRFIALAVLR
ncbi:MAG: hypothetical protein LBI84_01610 [Propionibacteriaceae bacterium]|jgi:hypothetical protein|nr:hypothetical protein [Propionibacteriaceae bacterium]